MPGGSGGGTIDDLPVDETGRILGGGDVIKQEEIKVTFNGLVNSDLAEQVFKKVGQVLGEQPREHMNVSRSGFHADFPRPRGEETYSIKLRLGEAFQNSTLGNFIVMQDTAQGLDRDLRPIDRLVITNTRNSL